MAVVLALIACLAFTYCLASVNWRSEYAVIEIGRVKNGVGCRTVATLEFVYESLLPVPFYNMHWRREGILMLPAYKSEDKYRTIEAKKIQIGEAQDGLQYKIPITLTGLGAYRLWNFGINTNDDKNLSTGVGPPSQGHSSQETTFYCDDKSPFQIKVISGKLLFYP